MNYYFKDLYHACTARQVEWDPEQKITVEFLGCELAGEVGEACNIIKKLARSRMNLPGSVAKVGDLEKELADIVITVNNIAARYGIDMNQAVRDKFNATSSERGFKTFLHKDYLGA